MTKGLLTIVSRGIVHFFSQETRDLRTGEKIVLLLILSHLERFDTITKADIVEVNDSKKTTTYGLIRALESKGYISSTRSNQFYSQSFIKLESKALIFASRLRRIVQAK